jgi:dihydroorotate dehydrogenase electron transfer subunit
MTCTKTVKIINIKKEADNVKTIRFKYDEETKPGQFFMVWLPGIDEIPMSVSYINELKGITVERVGEATFALHKLKAGDKVGIRGPYGNSYKILGKKILFVAGGTGIISLAPAIELTKNERKNFTVILGAKTRNELLFFQRIKKLDANIIISTDDGSFGRKALASQLTEEILKKEKYNQILTCGPEKMMKKILELGLKNKISVQASLERFIKCGIGICDACAIDGLHVCKDGPVFNDKILIKLKEFGKWKRDSSGRQVKIYSFQKH